MDISVAGAAFFSLVVGRWGGFREAWRNWVQTAENYFSAKLGGWAVWLARDDRHHGDIV
jgi:hypothetical protein